MVTIEEVKAYGKVVHTITIGVSYFEVCNAADEKGVQRSEIRRKNDRPVHSTPCACSSCTNVGHKYYFVNP